MGKLVQVNPTYTAVQLPRGYFNAGETTVLADAEYAALPANTTRLLTVLKSGTPEPDRISDVEVANDEGAALQVSSEEKLWRSNFTGTTQPDPTRWTVNNDNGDHLAIRGGDSSGSSYLRVSLNPLVESSEFSIVSQDTFAMPVRFGFGVSTSQRIVGQEVFVGMVGDDGAGGVDTSTTTITPDVALPATISVTTNVATIVIASHGFKGGDRVNLFGCPDSRINIGPVVITVIDANTFTVPLTIANGTYNSSGGTIRVADPLRWASNGAGHLFENATVTNASAISRRNGRKFRSTNITVGTTTGTQANASPYTDAFNATSTYEITASPEEVNYRSYAADSLGAMSGIQKYTQSLPDENANYHVLVRARVMAGVTRPVGRITAISKSASTTATVTTDVPHTLTTSDWVEIHGVLDQVNFPNAAVATQVQSVIDATHFTIILGTSSTTNSSGGFVTRVQGGQLIPAATGAVASAACTTAGILALTLSVTPAPVPLPGEYWQLHGTTIGLDGAYKVLRSSTTTLELEAPNMATFGSTPTGGGLIKRTDVRIHFARVDDFNRVLTEVVGGRSGAADANNSVPVFVTNSFTVATTQSTGSATATSMWQVGAPSGVGVTDVVSAALTTTTTTAAVTPGGLANIGAGANTFQVAVTAVSGTTPTLDVVVQESIDAGTNWKDVYHFERITATGSYTSPQIKLVEGSSVRYVQTVAGTTPSFTRSIRRNYFNLNAPILRRFFDRVTNVNGSNFGATYDVKGCDLVQLVVSMGAITTTAPQFVIEGSEDGAAWYQLSAAPLTSVASAVVEQTIPDRYLSFVRARVSTAGSGATLNYFAIKALGR